MDLRVLVGKRIPFFTGPDWPHEHSCQKNAGHFIKELEINGCCCLAHGVARYR